MTAAAVPFALTWRHVWAGAGLLVLALFGLAADSDGYLSPDVESSVLQAVELVGGRELVAGDPWGLVMDDGDVVSNRFPGAVLAFVPAALIGGGVEHAGTVAAILAAWGVLLLGLGLRRELGDVPALAAVGVLAFGTSVWSVAADALWPHTVTLFGIGLSAYGSSGWTSRWAVVVGDAVTLLARPHAAVIGAVRGVTDVLHEGFGKRRFLFVWSAVGGTVGLVGLVLYSRLLWDTWNPAAIYADPVALGAATACVGCVSATGTWATLGQLLAATDPVGRGLLVSSPFLLALLPGLAHAWRSSPGWVRGSALGGLGYLVVTAALHPSTGGTAFFGYRYPLELVVAATPLLAYAYFGLRPLVRQLFWLLAGASVAWHLLGAFFASEGIV